MIEKAFRGLVGLYLIKTWNVFATRFFYFGKRETSGDEGEFWLELECPWRIEQNDRIVVGSDDYGEPAEGNTDPNWNPRDDQTGHLQEQKLERLLGELREGTVFNTRPDFVVEGVRGDPLGGFQLLFSGGATLVVFPASTVGMQWLLSRPKHANMSLMDDRLSGSLMNSDLP